jgi:hypothetical protein
LVIGQLRRASEGVKEKLLCGHLLLCQHLLSCSYSISPIVRPSTKVSLISHKTHSQGSSPKGTQSQDSFTGFLSKGNSFTRIIHRVTLQRELIHKIHSQGSSSQQYMFYIHSTHVPQKRTRRTALIQSWSSQVDSCFHHYMISQLINKSKFRSTNSSSPCLQPQSSK